MEDAEEFIAKTKRKIAMTEALINEEQEKLTVTRAMYMALGMSSEEFMNSCRESLSDRDVEAVRKCVEHVEGWIQGLLDAVEEPEKHPEKHIDVKALKSASIKRKFV